MLYSVTNDSAYLWRLRFVEPTLHIYPSITVTSVLVWFTLTLTPVHLPDLPVPFPAIWYTSADLSLCDNYQCVILPYPNPTYSFADPTFPLHFPADWATLVDLSHRNSYQRISLHYPNLTNSSVTHLSPAWLSYSCSLIPPWQLPVCPPTLPYPMHSFTDSTYPCIILLVKSFCAYLFHRKTYQDISLRYPNLTYNSVTHLNPAFSC
jgi:hypothetical protein